MTDKSTETATLASKDARGSNLAKAYIAIKKDFDAFLSLDHSEARKASPEYDKAFHAAVHALRALGQFGAADVGLEALATAAEHNRGTVPQSQIAVESQDLVELVEQLAADAYTWGALSTKKVLAFSHGFLAGCSDGDVARAEQQMDKTKAALIAKLGAVATPTHRDAPLGASSPEVDPRSSPELGMASRGERPARDSGSAAGGGASEAELQRMERDIEVQIRHVAGGHVEGDWKDVAIDGLLEDIAEYGSRARAAASPPGETTPTLDEDSAEAFYQRIRKPLLWYFGTTDVELLEEAWEDQAKRRDEAAAAPSVGASVSEEDEDTGLDDLVYRTLKENEPHLKTPVIDLRLLAERIVTALRPALLRLAARVASPKEPTND